MKTGLIVLLVVVVVGLIFLGDLMGERNRLVTEHNKIDANWAQVENDMKRRADLIPNLVETVKGYAKQEQNVIGEIANARAALLSAAGSNNRQGEMQANTNLSSALGRLLVIQEAYPDLKSNENFLRLQDELAGTENRIAVDRRDYNESIRAYNTDIEQFPQNIAASMFGFHPDENYFKISEEDKKVPQVRF